MDENCKINFFKHNVCHVCKKISKDFKRCSGCKILSYCGKEHQADDWKQHKSLCKIIANEDKYGLVYDVKNQTELLQYKKNRGLLWHLQLHRKLHKFESEMFMFPRVCAVCFKREGLVDCPDCLSEFFCSDEHKSKNSNIHKKFCKSLKLSLDMECYFYYNDRNLNVFTTKRVKEELKFMPEGLDFLKTIVKTQIPPRDFNYVNSCDHNFGGFTILFALEKSGILVNRKLPKKTLEIHIVGATSFEYLFNWPLIIEIYFHWIKNLEEIHIVFIGPELINHTAAFQLIKTKFCQKCQSRKNLIVRDAELYRSFYHEKVSRLMKPDIVVAFNCGLHEFQDGDDDTWKESLGALVHHPGVPLLLTSYTLKEIKDDLKRLREETNIDIVYGPKLNPFANLRPLQNWEEVNIFYENQFMAVVKKK